MNERARKLSCRRRRRKAAVWKAAAPIREREHKAFKARLKNGRNPIFPPPRAYLWRRPSGNTNANVKHYDPAPRHQRIVPY